MPSVDNAKNASGADQLIVNEIYASLQGESTFAGLPCIFVRLTACNLRCSYCDTTYAFGEGHPMGLGDILNKIASMAQKTSPAGLPYKLPLVELTGGEPLLQANSLVLMRELCDRNHTVLLETSGALDIGPVDPRVRRIMDIKCPGSGESERNRWKNIAQLRATDEVKFVITSCEDYEWTKNCIAERRLLDICPILLSWAHPAPPSSVKSVVKSALSGQTSITQRELADRIIADALPVRFQLQMHKVIWPSESRGV
jgi:7-carboxy-7-deazaguanine synthase